VIFRHGQAESRFRIPAPLYCKDARKGCQKMKSQKQNLLISTVAFIVIAAIALFVLIQVKDRTYFYSPPYTPRQNKSTDVLVVYYSRSGNTEAMAREIARKFDADILQIEAERYSLDYRGWRNAANDADDKVTRVQI
jgi:hypothetical protein